MPNMWFAYLEFLKKWADSHRELAFCGTCPPSYQEWCVCEGQELYVE